MNIKISAIHDIFSKLEARGLLTAQDVELLSANLKRFAHKTGDPVYIKILAGVGAWVAAIFLNTFAGMFFSLGGDVGKIVIGILFLAGGVIVSRMGKNAFLTQLSLALALSGNSFVVIGSQMLFRTQNHFVPVISQGLVCLIVYPIYANAIYRFLAPLAFAALATSWIIIEHIPVLLHLLIAAEALLAGYLLLHKKEQPFLKPLAYSSAFMLPATLLFMNLTQIGEWGEKFREPLWPSSIVLTMGLLAVYIILAGGIERVRRPWMMLAVISTVFLGVFTTPGILVAIGLLLIGYALGDRALTVISFLFLATFLFIFYYAMNIDLMYKSWVIGGSGALLLVVRFIVSRLSIEEEA